MKRKLFLLSAVALMSVTLLGATSCNNSSNNPTSSATTNVDYKTLELDTSKEITVNFYHTMGKTLQETFEAYLDDDFKQLYPNIKVVPTPIGGYDDVRDQMTTELSAGKKGANIAYCYPDHIAMYNKAKSVKVLDDLIENEKYGLTEAQIDDFVDAYYLEGSCYGDGKMYTMPFSKSSEVLYYNKTAFDKLNLQVPDHWFSTGDSDVTSMEYACSVLKNAFPNATPLGYDSGANLFITMCKQMNIPYTSATGEKFLFNNPQAKELVGKFVEWRNKGWITTKALEGQYTSNAFTDSNLYMCVGSSAGASYQLPKSSSGQVEFDVELTGIPQADVNNKAVIQQGPSVCVFNNEDPQTVLASWLVIKFFTTSVEFQAQFSMDSGYTPVLKSVKENPIYKKFLNSGSIQNKAVVQCLAQQDDYFISPSFVGSSAARESSEYIITKCLSGEDINTVFAKAISDCQHAAE